MSITVEWGNDQQTFATLTPVGKTTVDDWVAAIQAVNALMDTVDHRVSTVVDFSQGGKLPPNTIASLPHVAQHMGHPNTTRLLVVIADDRWTRTLINIFSRVYRYVMFADSMDEAGQIIQGEELDRLDDKSERIA